MLHATGCQGGRTDSPLIQEGHGAFAPGVVTVFRTGPMISRQTEIRMRCCMPGPKRFSPQGQNNSYNVLSPFSSFFAIMKQPQ